MDRLYVTFVIIYRYGPYYDLVMEFHSTTSNHLIISRFKLNFVDDFDQAKKVGRCTILGLRDEI